MEQTQQNSPDALCAEILADATRQGGQIRHRAETEAASILSNAASEAEKVRSKTIEHARITAKKQTEMILETVKVERRRMHSARVEALLESVRDEVRRRLRPADAEAREIVVALAAEAIGQMPANDLVARISVADQSAFGNGLAEEIIRQARRPQLRLTIYADATLTSGDVTVQDTDGSQFWDNRLQARLQRLWPELRRQIAVAAGLVSDNNASGGPYDRNK